MRDLTEKQFKAAWDAEFSQPVPRSPREQAFLNMAKALREGASTLSLRLNDSDPEGVAVHRRMTHALNIAKEFLS